MKETIKSFGFALGLLAATALPGRCDSPVLPGPAIPAAPSADTGSGPKIKFDSEVFAFGKVPAGQPIKHSFIFTNVGDQTLEVTKVNPTCGCTVAGEWTKKVEPGQTGNIPLQVNVNQGWNGEMQKVVTVESNDKSRAPNVGLTMKFVVWKPIDVSQQYVILNIPPDSTNEISTVVSVNNNMDEPLSVYGAESANPGFAVQIKTNEAGKHFELLVKALPPFKPGNNISGQITAKTSAANMPTISLTAAANVQQVFSVMPAQVLLEAPPLAAAVQKSVTIQYAGTGLSKLSDPAFSAKGVDVQLAESQPGRIYTVTLSFPPGFESPGKPMELTLKSTSAQMPLIKVPVNQLPRATHSVAPNQPPPVGVLTPPALPKPAPAVAR